MELTANITAADWNTYFGFLAAKSRKLSKPVTRITTVIFAAIVGLYVIFISTIHWPTFALVSVLGLLSFAEMAYKTRRRLASLSPTIDSFLVGPWKYTITASVIETESASFKSTIKWEAVRDVVETKEAIIFVLDNAFAYLLPKRDLADPSAVMRHVGNMRAGVMPNGDPPTP